MKYIILIITLIIFACVVMYSYPSTNKIDSIPANPSSNIKTLYVAPVTVLCQGVGIQRCLNVRENLNDDWNFYYNQIEGFNFDEGYDYKITVEEEFIANAPMDASSVKLKLLSIDEKKPANYIKITSPEDFTEISISNDLIVSGEGRGLFENNVVVEAGDLSNMLTRAITTLTSDEVGGFGKWETNIDISGLPIGEAVIRAFSPSPVDGSMDSVYESRVRIIE